MAGRNSFYAVPGDKKEATTSTCPGYPAQNDGGGGGSLKRILLIGIILALLASLLITGTSVLASNSQFNEEDCGFVYQPGMGSENGNIGGSSTPAVVFTKQTSDSITGISARLGSEGTIGAQYLVQLWPVNYESGQLYPGPITTGTPLASVTMNAGTITSAPAWVDIPLTYAAALQGTKYAIVMSPVGNWGDSENCIVWYGAAPGSGDSAVYSNGWFCQSSDDWAPTIACLDFGVYTGYVPSPKVNTLNETMDSSNITFNGQVISFGDDSTVATGFQYGTVSGGPYPNSVQGNNAGYNNGHPVNFSAEIATSSVPVNTTIYYRAFMTGMTDGETDGPEYSFEVTAQSIANGAIETLPAKNVSYTTAQLGGELYSLGTDTSVNLIIYYGTDPSLSNSPITVQSGAVQLGEYDEDVTGLATNTDYYFQFASVSTNDGTIKGAILSFKTWDTSKAAGVNKVNEWLDAMGWGPGVWWVFLAFLMGIVWLIPGVREHGAIGIILDALILGGGITMVLDPWVVIILAVVAGGIIMVLLLKNRGN